MELPTAATSGTAASNGRGVVQVFEAVANPMLSRGMLTLHPITLHSRVSLYYALPVTPG